MNNKTIIYLCGDIKNRKDTGLNDETDKIKANLRALRCEIVSPSEMPFTKMSWSNTLKNRIELIKTSQVIYVLPNWEENIISRIEYTIAMDLKRCALFHPTSKKEIKQILTTLGD